MKKIIVNLLLLNLLALPVEVAAEDTVNTGAVSADKEAVSETPNVPNDTLDGDNQNVKSGPTTPETVDKPATPETMDQPASPETTNADAEPTPVDGWKEENGITYYYIENEKARGLHEISGKRYYFDLETGALQRGFFHDGEQTYYLDSQTGAMQTGWVLIDGKWYYFDSVTGVMKTGWFKDGNTWYYLDEAGVMKTGWVLYQNQWYYLNKSGAMMTGWVLVNNQWYYLRVNGAMQTGWLYYQNNWYYLKTSGAMAKGWNLVDDAWYYFYASGIMAKSTTIQGYTLGSNGAWFANLVYPKQVYSYNDMVADINKFKKNFPGFIQTQVIGKSVDGRNIYAIKLGRGNKEIFLNGSHHAREHMTTNVLMEMLDQYAASYSANRSFNGYNVKTLLNKVSIWFVPMVNPDGVMLVQEGHLTAKNPKYVLQLNGNKTDFSSWKANIRGVDLNRQYPADWANIANNTGKPSPENFKGYKPLSEPEVLAVYNFTKAHPFKVAVAYHSSGRILYWNFRQAPAQYNRDYQIALKYSKLTGYSLVFPGPNPSGGGFTDWFIQDMKMPGFTPEISTHTFGKPVPIANFDTIWKENQAAGLMLAQEALNL